MRTDTPIAMYVGIATAALGFVLMALAWNGAANWDCVQCQFPYLLSGGLAGLALVFIGAVVMVIQALRQVAADRALQLEELNATLAQVTALLAPPDEYDVAVAGEYRPRPRTSENGETPVGAAAGQGSWEEPA